MSDTPVDGPIVPRWLHAWAVLTVLAALPLVLLGAEVTTKQVGMVDPQGFRAPWHLLTVPLREAGLGYVIEHSHRLAGWAVGACSLVLALGLWLGAPRAGFVRWMGWVAGLAVFCQGMLGKYRVDLNALMGRDLALVHGLFAQLVFAVLVSVAVLTAPAWWRPAAAPGAERRRFRRLALVLCAMVYAQIVFGAVVRHLYDRTAQRAHVFFAFAVVAVVVWLVRGAWEQRSKDRAVWRMAGLLAVLVALQLALGVEAWVGRFGSGTLPELVRSTPRLDMVRSSHFLVGVLVFATSVVLTLLLYRPALAAVAYPALPEGRMEGAA